MVLLFSFTSYKVRLLTNKFAFSVTVLNLQKLSKEAQSFKGQSKRFLNYRYPIFVKSSTEPKVGSSSEGWWQRGQPKWTG